MAKIRPKKRRQLDKPQKMGRSTHTSERQTFLYQLCSVIGPTTAALPFLCWDSTRYDVFASQPPVSLKSKCNIFRLQQLGFACPSHSTCSIHRFLPPPNIVGGFPQTWHIRLYSSTCSPLAYLFFGMRLHSKYYQECDHIMVYIIFL